MRRQETPSKGVQMVKKEIELNKGKDKNTREIEWEREEELNTALP